MKETREKGSIRAEESSGTLQGKHRATEFTFHRTARIQGPDEFVMERRTGGCEKASSKDDIVPLPFQGCHNAPRFFNTGDDRCGIPWAHDGIDGCAGIPAADHGMLHTITIELELLRGPHNAS